VAIVFLTLDFTLALFGPTITLVISQLIQAFLGWLLAIFNVTILTSFYGFFVEGGFLITVRPAGRQSPGVFFLM
jgi:hypothetical protein